jgi:hypothetical protein
MGGQPNTNFITITVTNYNTPKIPKCQLVNCNKYGICQKKICFWLIQEIGKYKHKINLKGRKKQ